MPDGRREAGRHSWRVRLSVLACTLPLPLPGTTTLLPENAQKEYPVVICSLGMWTSFYVFNWTTVSDFLFGAQMGAPRAVPCCAMPCCTVLRCTELCYDVIIVVDASAVGLERAPSSHPALKLPPIAPDGHRPPWPSVPQAASSS